ncbi:IS66 family transposase [Cohnella fermenti]|nr:transposase [Cohnella fermenti]
MSEHPDEVITYEIKHHREALLQSGLPCMPWEDLAAFEDRYRTLIRIGLAENLQPPSPIEKKKGKGKQTKTKNLLDRLHLHQEATLAFMHDFRVPFTNNEAERAIRMIKNQQKVSGSFRSEEGAKSFARIRGFVSTLRKQGRPVLNTLRNIFDGISVIAIVVTTFYHMERALSLFFFDFTVYWKRIYSFIAVNYIPFIAP